MSEQDDPAGTAYIDQRDAAAAELQARAARQLRPQGFATGRLSKASETAHALWDAWTEGPRQQCEHVDLDGPAPMLLFDGVLYCYPCGATAKDRDTRSPTHCDSCGAGFALTPRRIDVVHQLGAVVFPMTLCRSCAEAR